MQWWWIFILAPLGGTGIAAGTAAWSIGASVSKIRLTGDADRDAYSLNLTTDTE